jgi:hypothetical protein
MKLLFIFLLFSVVVLGQDLPTAYTTHIHLGQWATGANPGATALNNQWTAIDSAAYAIDTAAVKLWKANAFTAGNSSTPDSLTSNSLDCRAGNVFIYNLAGSTTMTFSNFAEGQTINLIVHATGSYTIAFAGGTIIWAGGTQPVQTASATDIYIFQKAGGYIRADVTQNYAH